MDIKRGDKVRITGESAGGVSNRFGHEAEVVHIDLDGWLYLSTVDWSDGIIYKPEDVVKLK